MNTRVGLERLTQAWGPEQRQRMLLFGSLGVLALCGVVGLLGPERAELEALETEVAQLQDRLSAAPVPRPLQDAVQGSGASERSAWLDGPTQEQGAAVWPWLQQRLQDQGLQVIALRPQGLSAEGLPEQTVQLQLQGRWRDWLALSQAMAVHAPWWVVDQWQVTPVGVGDVRIELQARVGWLPLLLLDPKRAVWAGPQWPVAARAGEPPATDALLFGLPEVAAAAQLPSTPVLPQDPRHWPVRALRLQGVWQEAGQWHALLGAGLAQATVRVGQRVGQEGLRVRRVDMAGVALAADSGESIVRLAWQGDQ